VQLCNDLRTCQGRDSPMGAESPRGQRAGGQGAAAAGARSKSDAAQGRPARGTSRITASQAAPWSQSARPLSPAPLVLEGRGSELCGRDQLADCGGLRSHT